jgi:hypothetical protein
VVLELALGLRAEPLQLLGVDQRSQQPVQRGEVLERLLQGWYPDAGPAAGTARRLTARGSAGWRPLSSTGQLSTARAACRLGRMRPQY